MLPWLIEPYLDRFNDVRDTSLATLVRGDILGLILKGVLISGQRINEPDVAARLGASRLPVREALRELDSSGRVVARKHAGVFVRQLAAPEIRDLHPMRALLDGFAGRQAALRNGPENAPQLRLLDDSMQAMKNAANQHDVQCYCGENLRFHWAIVEAAGNQALTASYRGIVQKLHLSRLQNLTQDIGLQALISEHAEIFNALRQGDTERCNRLLSEHIEAAHSRLNRTVLDSSLAS
jgi:DNA-binding GntR family transcriptional regulator